MLRCELLRALLSLASSVAIPCNPETYTFPYSLCFGITAIPHSHVIPYPLAGSCSSPNRQSIWSRITPFILRQWIGPVKEHLCLVGR